MKNICRVASRIWTPANDRHRRALRLWGRPPVRRRAAFTLIEMLLVLAILATLIAIVAPRLAGRSEQAKFTAAQTQIASLESATDAFEVDNGRYPRSLEELITPPSDTPNWRGPYLKKAVPPDPWGNPYVYEFPGRRNPLGYDLYSVGPDGRAGGEDDIGNW